MAIILLSVQGDGAEESHHVAGEKEATGQGPGHLQRRPLDAFRWREVL